MVSADSKKQKEKTIHITKNTRFFVKMKSMQYFEFFDQKEAFTKNKK